MRQLFLLICLVLTVGQAFARQTSSPQKRIIYFTDKANSPYSVDQPLLYLSPQAIERRAKQNIPIVPRDYPVNPDYVTRLKQVEGVTLWYTSRWFNAAVVQCTDEKLAELLALDFVKNTGTLNRIWTKTLAEPALEVTESEPLVYAVQNDVLTPEAYGPSFTQANMLGAVDLHNQGFTGQGKTIAVFDTGFPNVNTIGGFAHLRDNNRILATYDFVARNTNAYVSNGHGTSVLSTMGAYLPGQIIGTAYNANYMLFRTEDVASEHKIEEINWLLAAEFADSAGADILNSSLGYNIFQDPSPSYSTSDMDGNTALVTRAADYAAATGMLVVVSAGNSGTSTTWPIVAAPADADSVLTVGSVNRSGVRTATSSTGPTADGRIKPDVMAVGEPASALNTAGTVANANGTSFSAPIIAGLAASLWQAYPDRTNMEILRMIRRLGSLYPNPNNQMGYGIPDYSRTIPVAVTAPTTTGDANCGPGVLTLSASGGPAGGRYRWFTQATGGTSIPYAGDATYNTPILSETTTYYVSALNEYGDESARVPVTATISAVPAVSLAAYNAPVCSSNTSLNLTGGEPAGGAYAGTGVSNGVFNASVAGVGTHTISYTYISSDGCTASANQDITVSVCTSLPESEAAASLVVYPNPVQDKLHIALPQVKSKTLVLRLVDATGKIVLTQHFQQLPGDFNQTIDLQHKAKGMYLLQLVLDGEVINRRFVRE